jgi:hypothetical protein
MPTPDGRRFDDDEVSLILRRASELQEARLTAPGDGMSLADLEAIAQEAGLDPALVRRAASELPSRDGPLPRPTGPGERFLGAPTVLRYERVLGGEMPSSEYDVLVEEVRRSLNDVGEVSALGRTLAWSSTPPMRPRRAGGRQVNVTVVARGGQTAIRVEERVTSLAGALFGGIMGGVGGGGSGIAVGVGLAAFHSGAAAVGLWGLLIAGSYTLARTIFTSAVRRRARELAALADRLAAVAETAVPTR